MRYFIDTEFSERPNTIELISLGMVADNGRELYIEMSDFDESLCNDWVRANVLPHLWSRQKDKTAANKWFLDGNSGGLMTKANAAREIIRFIGDDTPEFWGYFSAYDWVVFCWLFGAMADLPRGWPMLAMDVKQYAMMLGDPELPAQDQDEHHALADAIWIKQAWEFLANWSNTDRG